VITVIVPVHNEEENIWPLIKEIKDASADVPVNEIIYINDASTDGTLAELQKAREQVPFLRILQHNYKSGQSAAFMNGVRAASNSVIVLMDGDGQNNPADIGKLYAEYLSQSKQTPKMMVAGQREKRQDNLIRIISSRLANNIRRAILNDSIRDTGCSLKLIRREDYLNLPFFNHMHRYLPAMLIRDNVHIATVDVSHRPREHGSSKYGFWDRLWVGVYDLIGVSWLIKRGMNKDLDIQEVK